MLQMLNYLDIKHRKCTTAPWLFSSNQFIFGYNIANSLVITDRTLVLTLVISSDIISDHLNAIHSVKKRKDSISIDT